MTSHTKFAVANPGIRTKNKLRRRLGGSDQDDGGGPEELYGQDHLAELRAGLQVGVRGDGFG